MGFLGLEHLSGRAAAARGGTLLWPEPPNMTNIVLLCPGQGAQAVGMAKAWYDAHPHAKAVLDEADRIFAGSAASHSVGGRTLTDIAFNGPIDVLSRTDLSQPALFAAAVACHRALPAALLGLKMRAVAGLSLGEYTALHLAGAFSFEDGLRLVMRRGQLMQQAAEASRGGMVALIGADEAQANAEALHDLYAWLGVKATFTPPDTTEAVNAREDQGPDPDADAVRERLARYFAPHIRALEAELGRRIDPWHDPIQ